MKNTPLWSRCPRAFTLVELLVSIAVLVIIVAFVALLMNSATLTSTSSRKHMDADASARLIFDRMADDFAGMVKRPDVDYIFYKGTGSVISGSNDAMFFYSEAPAYSTGTSNLSSASLVGYRVTTGNSYYSGYPVLERLGQALTWDQASPGATPSDSAPGGMVFTTYASGSATPMSGSTLATNWASLIGAPPYTSNEDPAYHVLSDQVFRMEICFLLKDGTYSQSGATVANKGGYCNAPTVLYSGATTMSGTVSQPFATANYFAGTTAPDTAGNVYGLPPDLGGVVVTLALLDDASRKLVTASQLNSLGAKLTDSLSRAVTFIPIAGDATLPAQQWLSKITSSGFASGAGVPQTAVSQIHIYQRIFYLNAN